ncbi:MAG: protein kinase [Candidatus Eisenbacteria bacterium]|uniref:Protein kinase n=1 Tax=Eiseniibacteriota bacterium TaxID=2212470 RepID=A0A849SET0_UNCEI|nr:protein kinase [Candidatus Eisenbacteria bacterium]
MPTPDASETDPGAAQHWPGRVILGRYRVERLLGHGGMGEVLLAQDTLLNRRVALKRVRSTDQAGGDRRRAILKEARRASRISDARIAAIHDVLELDDDLLIVMEYVDGTTLRERMVEPVPLQDFWDLSTQCIAAVAVAHDHGLIHRDIKPENLMVTTQGQIKILDFGIARRTESTPDTTSPSSTTWTAESEANVIAGTPQYMAPEAHYGGTLDGRTDIFALGTVFYEMLAARNPFAGDTYDAVRERIMNAAPEPVTRVNPTVGVALSDVIAKMMSKDPARRHPTCADLMQDLLAARGSVALPDTRADRIATRLIVSPWRRAVSWSTLMLPLVAIVAALLTWGVSRAPFASKLPRDRNLAVLPPATPGASEDFAEFGLGSIARLHARLQRHQDRPGFQLASFQDALDERVDDVVDARRVLGTNLTLASSLEQRTDSFRGRLELWDGATGKRMSVRVVETPLAKPFEFEDRLYREAVKLVGLEPRRTDASSEFGVRGAGTLRFLLQGIGRVLHATTEAQARHAIEDLELACRTEPEAAAARTWLAHAELKCYRLASDTSCLARAEASAREAIALDSSRSEGHRVLGAVWFSRKNASASLEALARACRLDSTDDAAWSNLGRTYARLGRPEQERAVYEAVIAQRPHCWQPYWWLAVWQFRAGHVDEAIGMYESMIRRSPDFHRGYQGLGGMLVLRGDYDRAIDSLQRAIALCPTKIAFDNLGTAFFNSHRFEESIGAYNQSFQFGFADYQSWLNLGDAYFWLRNRSDQASEAYAQAVRLGREEERERVRNGNSFDVMIPAHLATLLPKLGQPDSARTELRRALAADSANSMVQYCAALTLWQLGERDRATTWLERAVQGGYPLAWLRDSPIFEEWRAERRFGALIAAIDPQPQPISSSPGERR